VGELVVVKSIVQNMLCNEDPAAVPAGCKALARLQDGGICRSHQIIDILIPLTESQPTQLQLQERAGKATQWLVRAGSICEAEAKDRAPYLLNAQWPQLLARFAGADQAEAEQTVRFHAEVQSVFHQEVVKHFEYEALRDPCTCSRGALLARGVCVKWCDVL
jgi:hypothetical protein